MSDKPMNIADRCLERAQECETAAKSHVCRSNAELRAALDKAAAVYRMVAGWAESMDSTALADRCMASADEYLRSAKPYAKRAFSPKRAAYVKGAAVLREIAEMAGTLSQSQSWVETLGNAGISTERFDPGVPNVAVKRLHEAAHAEDASPQAKGRRKRRRAEDGVETQFPPSGLYNVGGGYIGPEGE